MTTAKNILKKLLDVKDAIIEGVEMSTASNGVMTMVVDLRLRKGLRCRCPFCSSDHRLSKYDIEATNNKIKVVIRRSYGFRNLENMFDLVFLCCSNLRIPLPNRPEVVQTL